MENNKKEPNYLLAIFIIVELVFLIIVGSKIINIINEDDRITKAEDQPRINISGLPSDNINLRQEFIDEISHNILDAIKQNSSILDLPKTNAIVRNDSLQLKSFNHQNFNALSFIVDIPNLQQSYQVYYKYPIDTTEVLTTENPFAILCLEDKAQIIYPNFKCRSSYPTNIRQQIASDYIKFLEFDNFSIAIDNNDPTQININPITDVTDEVAKEYIAQIKASIQDLGVSPEIFKYHVIQKADLNYDNSY